MKRRQFLGGLAATGSAAAIAAAGCVAPAAANQARKLPSSAELPFASASEAAQAIRRGDISSVELTRLMLGRIDCLNPRINAIVETFSDEALRDARRCDEELRSGMPRGALHGVPITIKETNAIAGHVQTYGSPALKDNVQRADNLSVSRLRGAGAVLLGRTNVPLLANDWQTFNAIYGATNNPWNLERTPGGSSGGCASALATGLSFLSLGGDLGGSIRVPSHFCGLFGHRPTRGVLPAKEVLRSAPPTPVWEAFVPGPLARSADDLELAMEILGGPTVPESAAMHWRMPPARKKALRDYRIGYVLDDPFCPVVPELAAVYAQAIAEAKHAGATLVEGWPEGFSLEHNYHVWAYLTTSGASTGTGVDLLVRGRRPPGARTYFEVAREAETGTFFDYNVKRRSKGTPDRRRRGTPFSDNMMLVC